MKIESKHLLLCLSFIILNACNKDDELTKIELDSPYQVIQVKDEPQLLQWLDEIGFPLKNGRTNSILNSLDLSEAVRYTDSLGNNIYSLYIPESDPHSLKNVWLYETQNGLTGRLIHHQMNQEWLADFDIFPGWDHFNGIFSVFDLEGLLLYETEMFDGTSDQQTEGGRIAGGRCNSQRTSGSICVTTTWEICTSVEGVEIGCYYDTSTECVWFDGCGGSGLGGSGPTFDPVGSSGGTSTGATPNNNDDISCEGNLFYYKGRCVLPCKPNQIRDRNGSCMSEEDAWEEDICTTNSFDSNTCLSSVLNKLKSTNAAASLLDKFENSSWIDLCLDASLSTSANAQSTLNNSEVIINFNTSKLGRSQLSIARTFLHEMVHAELFRKVKSVGGIFSQNDFPGIFDYYRRFVENWQHQQMAAHYINTIANGLSQFDGENQQLSYYKDIAWIGLWKVPDYTTDDPNDFIETQAWRDLSLSEQNRIKNAIASFQSNENKTCQ